MQTKAIRYYKAMAKQRDEGIFTLMFIVLEKCDKIKNKIRYLAGILFQLSNYYFSHFAREIKYLEFISVK